MTRSGWWYLAWIVLLLLVAILTLISLSTKKLTDFEVLHFLNVAGDKSVLIADIAISAYNPNIHRIYIGDYSRSQSRPSEYYQGLPSPSGRFVAPLRASGGGNDLRRYEPEHFPRLAQTGIEIEMYAQPLTSDISGAVKIGRTQAIWTSSFQPLATRVYNDSEPVPLPLPSPRPPPTKLAMVFEPFGSSYLTFNVRIAHPSEKSIEIFNSSMGFRLIFHGTFRYETWSARHVEHVCAVQRISGYSGGPDDDDGDGDDGDDGEEEGNVGGKWRQSVLLSKPDPDGDDPVRSGVGPVEGCFLSGHL